MFLVLRSQTCDAVPNVMLQQLCKNTKACKPLVIQLPLIPGERITHMDEVTLSRFSTLSV